MQLWKKFDDAFSRFDKLDHICSQAKFGQGRIRGYFSPYSQSYPVPTNFFSILSFVLLCRRRRRNVYDKKPQRYAKDNRTAHLTARSGKSVSYVTNNKKLYSTFCTVEANY